MPDAMGKCVASSFVVISLLVSCSILVNGLNFSFPVFIDGSKHYLSFASNSTTMDALSDDLLDAVFDFSSEHFLPPPSQALCFHSFKEELSKMIIGISFKEMNSEDTGCHTANDIPEGMMGNVLDNDLTKDDPLQHTNSIPLTIISAFYDIGREDWLVLSRNVDEYMDGFFSHLKLPGRYDIVLFIDDRYLVKVMTYIEEQDISYPIRIFPINLEWLQHECWAWKQLEKERSIMKSELHRILRRYYCNDVWVPEKYIPEYTVLNHAKIDFISYAIRHGMAKTDWVAWSDFGFFHAYEVTSGTSFPTKPINLAVFDPDKVTYGMIGKLDERDFDPFYTVKYAPERVTGTFFLSTTETMLLYQSLYHTQLLDFQRIGIADDDQHLVIRCILAMPSLFDLRLIQAPKTHYITFSSSTGGKRFTVPHLDSLRESRILGTTTYDQWLQNAEMILKTIRQNLVKMELTYTGSLSWSSRQMSSYYWEIQRELKILFQDSSRRRVNVCETGFNAGESAVLFLELHPYITYYGWDLGTEYTAVVPSADFLKNIYDDRLNIYLGDSKITLPVALLENQIRCDIMHIDGEHSYEGALADMRHFHSSAPNNSLLMIDDCDNPYIFQAVKQVIFHDKLYSWVSRVRLDDDDMPREMVPRYSKGYCIARTISRYA